MFLSVKIFWNKYHLGDFMYKQTKKAGVWVLIVFLLAGIVLGGFLGEVCINALNSAGFPYLNWLRYGVTFGITDPFALNLEIISFVFGITFKFNICGIIGMLLSYLLYRRVK